MGIESRDGLFARIDEYNRTGKVTLDRCYEEDKPRKPRSKDPVQEVKLYLIKLRRTPANQRGAVSAVVTARSLEAAKLVHPSGDVGDDAWSRCAGEWVWCDKDRAGVEVLAELVGAANPGMKEGVVIHTSYNGSVSKGE